MQKPKITVSLSPEIVDRIEGIAARYDLTPNALLATVAAEISYIPPHQFFERLARLSAGVPLPSASVAVLADTAATARRVGPTIG